MLPLSPTISNHVRFLLHGASDSNYESIFRELCQFVEFGREGATLLLQTCLDELNLNDGDVSNYSSKRDLVSAVFKYLLDKPNFCTLLCEALRGPSMMSERFLGDLSTTLNLSTAERIGVGLALSESENPNCRARGHNFCIAHIEELYTNPNIVVPNEQIQDVIMFLYRSEGLSKHVDYFTKILSLLPRNGNSFSVQAPILTDDVSSINSSRQLDLFYEESDYDFEAVLAEIEQEMSMADILRELGYGCTASTSHCKDILSFFLPLDELMLSKLLGTIARTHVGLDDAQNIHSSLCSALDSSFSSDLSTLTSWNVDVLVDTIKQLAPKTNWMRVMQHLDHEGFNVPDETSFSLLMSIYNKACQVPFPLDAICGSVWKNSEGQLSFLRYAVSAHPDVFTFAHCSRQLTSADSAHLFMGAGNQAWSCLELLDVLCQLAERGHASSVRLMLEYPLNLCPEALLVGIAHINSAYNLLQYEVSSTVFPMMLNDPLRWSVIDHLWRVNPNLVLQGFVDAHTDPSSLLRIIDVCQELKILSPVLDSTPLSISIRLATFAYRKEHTHLEKWLNENLNMYVDAFFEGCVAFLREILSNVASDVPHNPVQQSLVAVLNAYREACPIFFKVLQANSGNHVFQKFFEELKSLYALSTPKIQNPMVVDSSTSEGSLEDIEAEFNAYFLQIFSGQLTIDAIVQMLASYKESSENREQLIYDRMITYLVEEYEFFPEFPDRQLKLVAVLFGSLIKHNLMTHLHLGIALRGVLDALRKPVDSKMFMFGTTALEQFTDRLVEWPQYCNHLLQVSHLRGAHAELVLIIERALAHISSSQAESGGGNSIPTGQQRGSTQSSVDSIEVSETSWQFVNPVDANVSQQLSPFQQKNQGFLGDRLKGNATSVNSTKPLLSHVTRPFVSAPVDSVANPKPTIQSLRGPLQTAVSSSPGFLRSSCNVASAGISRQPASTGFGAALNIETLITASERRDNHVEAPASEIQDKILFIINNISVANIESKAKEFMEVLKEQHYPWFALYMVMKRASIEPNFHDLYMKFLDKVNSKSLNMEIVKATYENCKVLLRSDLIKYSSEERSLLKNLGSWLGKYTISRNKALRAIEIDPKVLIMKAYEKGLMIAIIPFISKVLESCQHSLAYRPPNPWTMGILGLLAEIYSLPNLKMNLKFDIEVLLKNLGVDMKDVKPTALLKDRVREVEGNPDFSNKDISVSKASVIAEINQTIIPAMNQTDLQPEANSKNHPGRPAQYTASLHTVPVHMVEDDKREPLVTPERVPSAHGLTQITASQTQFSLGQLLTVIPNPENYIKINSKLNSLGRPQVHRIMQMAMDKAVTEIVSPVIQRSVTIASRTTRELILKDFAIESDENAVYRAAHLMVASLAGSLAHVTCKEPLRTALSNNLHTLLPALNVNSECLDDVVQILITDNLDLGCAVIENVASDKAMELIDAEIGSPFAALRKQRETAEPAYYDVGTYAQGSSARIHNALPCEPRFLSVGQRRVYNDFNGNIWQNQSSQGPSFIPTGPPGLGGGLFSSGLLKSGINSASQVVPGFGSAQRLDQMQEETNLGSAQLSISTAHGASDGVMQPSAEISSIISSLPPNATVSEMHITDSLATTKDLGAVIPSSSVTPCTDRMVAVLSESESLPTTGDTLDKYQHLAQKVSHLFSVWHEISDVPNKNEAAYCNYISQLHQLGFLKGDSISEHFFRILTELSVTHCLASEQVPSPFALQSSQQFQNLSFMAVDAYANLVVLVLKYSSLDQGSSKVAILQKVLSAIVGVIQNDAEERKSYFNPRPYFRLFVNWILDLTAPDPALDDLNFHALASLSNAFHALQPLKVPAFSFAWLELVSHRSFMPRLLTTIASKGWPLFQHLLVDLFKFMEPYLRNAELGEPVHFLYKGTLKVLLVLLHDFPEFLCDYHFSLCDVIPPSCIQMRNVILSAFPRNMRLPDPSTPNLKIDLLAEMSQSPHILSDVDGALKAKQIKTDIDDYLKTRPEGSRILTELKQKLFLPQNEANLAGTRYNVPLINSLVLYVGMQAILQLQSKSATQYASMQQMMHSSPMDNFLVGAALDIFQSLINNLDTEGRYLFLNAVANQLRYPNNHTHYFSFVLLYLFVEASQEIIQEQITRVLLERLIVNRPHPWGLLVTFIELVKNSRYGFWDRSFTRCAPEIEKLFESVSRHVADRKP